MAKSNEKNVAINWLSSRFGRFELSDILSASQHSRDFNVIRSDYIRSRLRFMQIVFAVSFCLWIPIDYLTLTAEHFTLNEWARASLSTTLICLWLISFISTRPWLTYSVLTLTLMAVMGFYATSMLIMASGTAEAPLAGFKAIPVLILALTGLFPLTLAMGLANIALIGAAFITLATWQGHLSNPETLNELWLIALISSCSLWIQSGQLLMLLKLYRESTRDPLTGLINRRVLMKQLESEQLLFEQQQRPFSILMLDLDSFKRVNDNYGHQAGNTVLKAVATILTKNARPMDTVARYGGEEFMMVLPGLTAAQSAPLAEQIRSAIEQQQNTSPKGDSIQVTTSTGLTDYRSGDTLESVIERADTMLYQAKQQGHIDS